MSVENHSDIRAQLPSQLLTWRVPGSSIEDEDAIWENTRTIFQDANIDLWRRTDLCFQRARKGEMILSSGFAYIRSERVDEWGLITKVFNSQNGLCHGATAADGHSVIVRIISIGDEGQNHLNVLRNIACGNDSILVDNHTIPLWREVHFEDLVFGVFPFIGERLRVCYAPWLQNSVGDILDMILQALEGLSFIHQLKIAHRDADKANFLVQWHPESLATMRVPLTRPRVYLTDFERASEVPTGILSARTDPLKDEYLRPIAPELQSGGPYDVFKVDVWQFADSFRDFRSTIPAIDEIFHAMRDDDPATRLSSSEARDRLAKAVHDRAPIDLLVPPEVLVECDYKDEESGNIERKVAEQS